MTDTTDILTPAEAAAWLKLPEKSVVALCRQGHIPGAVKFGKHWRISRAALVGYFEEMASKAPIEVEPADRQPRRPRKPANRADSLRQLRS